MVDELDCQCATHITCPYCGFVCMDSWEYNQDCNDFECPECEKISDLSVEVSVSYTTHKKVNKENHG